MSLGPAHETVHGEVTHARAELYRSRFLESDLADPSLEVALAEPARAPKCRYPGLSPHLRALRQVDVYLDGVAASAWSPLPPSLWRLDDQYPVVELDASLLGGGHVSLIGLVARAYLDEGVGALTGLDPDVTDAKLQRHEDGYRSIESGHSKSLFGCE